MSPDSAEHTTIAGCPHPGPMQDMEKLTQVLNVLHAAQHGQHQMLIYTIDTDVVVLAVFAKNHLPVGCELWLAFGTCKSFRYLAAHQIAVSLGPQMSCALPTFHALNCCDNVSSLAEHGKKTVWSTWKSLPGVTHALLIHADGPKEIPDDAMNIIEYVILLFDRTST